MKNKCILYFLAVGVLTASPAFADKIPTNSTEQSGNSVSIHESLKRDVVNDTTNALNLSQGAWGETTFSLMRGGFGGNLQASIMEALPIFKEGKSNEDGHFVLFGFNHDDPFGKGGDGIGYDHKPKKHYGDGSPAPTVAVPEPGSLTLVLFGLGTLCILLCRRNSQ